MKRFVFAQHMHNRFYMFFLLLLSLIFIRYALQINIPKILFLIVVVILATFGNKTEILTMCLCCIPLHGAIDFYYSVVFCIVIYVLKFYKTINVKPVVALVLVMIAWELFHSLTHGLIIIDLISCFVPIVVLTIIMCTDLSDCDYSFMVRMLAIATTVICIILICKLLYFTNFDFGIMITQLQRLGLDSVNVTEKLIISGGEINPNTLGVICVLASTGLLQLCSVGKGKIQDLLLVALLLLFGILTSSRTCIVCMILMFLLLLFSQQGGMQKKIRLLVLGILFLVCIISILMILFPGRIEYLIRRFQVNDVSNGRVELMKAYHDFIFSNLNVFFYGVGYQGFGTTLTEICKVSSNVPHNSIQEIMVCWGLPGLLMIGILLVMMIFYSKSSIRKKGLLSFIPLIIILAKAMVGQMLTSGYTMLALSFAYLSLCQNFEPVQKGIDEKT